MKIFKKLYKHMKIFKKLYKHMKYLRSIIFLVTKYFCVRSEPVLRVRGGKE